MNENETLETETDLSVETTSTPLTRKALILAGSVAGIIIAGGFAFLKNRNADAEQELADFEEELIRTELGTDNDTSE